MEQTRRLLVHLFFALLFDAAYSLMHRSSGSVMARPLSTVWWGISFDKSAIFHFHAKASQSYQYTHWLLNQRMMIAWVLLSASHPVSALNAWNSVDLDIKSWNESALGTQLNSCVPAWHDLLQEEMCAYNFLLYAGIRCGRVQWRKHAKSSSTCGRQTLLRPARCAAKAWATPSI